MHQQLSRTFLAVVLACAGIAVQAQSAGKSLVGSAPQGKLMTRDELRVCMKERQSQQERAAAIEKRRAEVAAEVEAVNRQKADVQSERDAYNARLAQGLAFNERVKAHAERLSIYNQRVKDFQDHPPKDAERVRGQLEAEGEAVAKADADLKAEAPQWTAASMEPARTALSEHIQAQQAAAAAAVEHKRKLNEDIGAYDESLASWTLRCGNRPYREEDEKAIRAGK